MKKKVEWKSRHKDGQHFPVIRGNKCNLPHSLKLSVIPLDSKLRTEENWREKAIRDARKAREDDKRVSDVVQDLTEEDVEQQIERGLGLDEEKLPSAQSEDIVSIPELRLPEETKILCAGVIELAERGMILGKDYHISEDGVTITPKYRLRERGTGGAGAPKDKWEEMGWMPPDVRRERARKMSQAFASNIIRHT